MDAETIRQRMVAAANAVVGLGANPEDEARRERYLDLIAPDETENARDEMAQMSGCGLVVAGIWRAAGVVDARLDAPYRIGSAITRLVAIARSAGAWVAYGRGRRPSPGDMVLVGGQGAGGPEHVYTVTSISGDADPHVTSVDGGRRDAHGYQTIDAVTRVWKGGRDVAGHLSRAIAGWIDCSRLPIVEMLEQATREIETRRGSPAADSSVPVVHEIDGSDLITLATRAFGATPVFWGRYFTSPTTGGTVEYRHAKENAALRAAGIRVLPIARQTNRVAGTAAMGEEDGQKNAADLVATFGEAYLVAQGGEVYMFLDVEGAPSMSLAYYQGWVRGLGAASGGITIHPCVYATQYDSPTWSALKDAVGLGIPCAGVWVAHWSRVPGFHPVPVWSKANTRPVPAPPVPVLAWQYANEAYGGDGFDCNEINPDIDLNDDLLRYLVLPPE
jgi:hypothetical protein